MKEMVIIMNNTNSCNPKNFAVRDEFSFEDLVNIMNILREDCPWDREQTHKSIRQNLLEEAYEAAEAIDNGDSKLLCEELGDVLLQVVFHARISDESEGFNIKHIINGICQKLIVRHPHIFADEKVTGPSQVLDNWDEIKRQTKQIDTVAESMQSVSIALPALMRADKVGKKAKKAGFDFPDIHSAADKVSEELAEVLDAASPQREEEIGDLLFSAVNLARICGIDSETALTKATDKFINRFARVEQKAKEISGSIEEMGLVQADKLWNQLKHNI